MTIEQLRAEAMKLPRGQRAHLVEELILSLEDESQVDRAWDDEADRRYHRYLAGEEEAIPLDAAMAELRDELLR